jgi:transcriptional regulator with XRE-family HTH domain
MAADSDGVPPICIALRTARETAGLTQESLATLVGVSQKRLSNWETAREPKLDMIANLERAIDGDRRRGWLLRLAGYVEDAATLEEMIDSDPRLDPRGRLAVKALIAPSRG